MLLRTVDFPNALLDAQRSGSLAIFAGAGVSMQAPSSYPNFNDLAEQVAQGSIERQRDEPVDRLLGRLATRNVSVHDIVRKILSDPNSKPNAVHSHLLELFDCPANLRLVTTNFDTHFTSAALSLFKADGDIEIYSAPALPLGDAFSGIVYLHGSVEKSSERMVLTDADFGRAYLTEGWARRFLQKLFSRFVVLFVGYSHNDPVMNYLARGLPPEQGGPHRFALTMAEDSEESERWRYLGIHPIFYGPAEGNDKHAVLHAAVQAWSEVARKGALDQEQKIKQIVEIPVGLEAEELDYVLDALRDASTARFFARYAKHPSWLRWTDEKGILARLFNTTSASEIDRVLARWFAENFVCDHFGDALTVVRKQGQFLNEVLWLEITHYLFRRNPRPTQETFGRWLPVLFSCVPRHGTHDLLDYILSKMAFPENASTAVLLFESLTRLRGELKKDLWKEIKDSADDVKLELASEGSEHWLSESWQRVFRPHLDHFADKLVWIATSHLHQAHSLLDSQARIHEHWDELSLHRNVIEHAGSLRNSFDVLVDALRDILELYISSDTKKADSLVELWSSSSNRLLKRLAIFGVAKNTHWTADDKVAWIKRNSLLYVPGLKHEVFLVLQNAFPHSSETLRTELLNEAIRPLESTPDSHKAYEVYNLLVWLRSVAPECSITNARFQEVAALHPDFGPRDHPDLDFVMGEVTSGEPPSPMTANEILATPAPEQIEFLVSFNPPQSFDGPTRQSPLSNVERAVTGRFEWGDDLAKELIKRKLWKSDLWNSIVDGWNSSKPTDAQWAKILQLLRANPQVLEEATYRTSNLLLNAVRAEHVLPDECLPLAMEVSEKLWTVIQRSPERERGEQTDWLQVAINRPAGVVAQFWLQVVSRLRSQAGDEWTGIPERYRLLFTSVVMEEAHESSTLARIIFTSQLHFLYGCDPSWAKTHIVPLLDVRSNKTRAVQCWQGYLFWGRWLEDLLPILLPLYELFCPYLAEQSDDIRRQFCGHLAAIACFGSINPVQNGWLQRFLTIVRTEERVTWASSVDQMLRGMKEPAKVAAWELWIRKYWQNRINGLPVALSGKEAGEMAEWSLHLQPVFPEVVEKISTGPAPELEHSFIYYELPDTPLPDRYPESVARLILFLLRKSQAPVYDFDRLATVFQTLAKRKVDTSLLHAICEELAKMGFPDASRLRTLLKPESDKDETR